MAETFTRYDAADYLKTDEDVAAYLDASAEDGDPGAMAAALGAVARARNMSQLARDTGMTREGLYKALAPDGNPGFGTVAKVARALGFEIGFRPVVKAAVLRMDEERVVADQAESAMMTGGEHTGIDRRP